MIVVNASVAVKWFIPEAGEEDAAQLLGGKTHLMAPALIRLEVTGAIIRRYREGHLSEKRAREGTQAWEAMTLLANPHRSRRPLPAPSAWLWW